MIPHDLLKRLTQAYDKSIQAALEAGKNELDLETDLKLKRAEEKFEAALCAIVDAANKQK